MEPVKNFEILPMSEGNRMVRFGFGQNEGRWFIRLDLWHYGFRYAFNP